MADSTTEIDLDSVIDRLLEGVYGQLFVLSATSGAWRAMEGDVELDKGSGGRSWAMG